MGAYLPNHHRVASALAATTDRSMWVRRSHIERGNRGLPECSQPDIRQRNPYVERFTNFPASSVI